MFLVLSCSNLTGCVYTERGGSACDPTLILVVRFATINMIMPLGQTCVDLFHRADDLFITVDKGSCGSYVS